MSRSTVIMPLAKVMIAAAWADGTISNDEINCMKDLLFQLPEMTARDWSELEIYIDSPVVKAERERLVADLNRVLSKRPMMSRRWSVHPLDMPAIQEFLFCFRIRRLVGDSREFSKRRLIHSPIEQLESAGMRKSLSWVLEEALLGFGFVRYFIRYFEPSVKQYFFLFRFHLLRVVCYFVAGLFSLACAHPPALLTPTR